MYLETIPDDLPLFAGFFRGFLIAKNYSRNQLNDLALLLKKEKTELSEIIFLNDADSANAPLFDSLKKKNVVVSTGKEKWIDNDGLILPQDKPVILIIDNFDKLAYSVQQQYLNNICKKDKDDYYPKLYLHYDSVIILNVGTITDLPLISYKCGTIVLV